MNRTTPLALVLASLAFSTAALAGPLTPPAGPVTSSMKTLTEVEPRIAINQTNTPGDVANQFKISQPGSYYLTADMTSTPGLNPCIVINTSDVTLDFNGFSIRTAATAGITIAGDHVTVRNGRIGLSGGNINAGVLIQPGAGERGDRERDVIAPPPPRATALRPRAGGDCSGVAARTAPASEEGRGVEAAATALHEALAVDTLAVGSCPRCGLDVPSRPARSWVYAASVAALWMWMRAMMMEIEPSTL